MQDNPDKPSVLLVHGAWADGSGWEGVYSILKREGFDVTVVQNPTLSLYDDVELVKLHLRAMKGPVILVGHSYGGAIITEAGNDPKVAGLVYVAGWALADGEAISSLLKNLPLDAARPPILPPQDGILFLDRQKFPAAFAGDVDPSKASFMADAQIPGGVKALDETVKRAAWNDKPSWYLISTQDKMIPPDLQHFMAQRAGASQVEIAASHAVYLSQPSAVASLILAAADQLELRPQVRSRTGEEPRVQ